MPYDANDPSNSSTRAKRAPGAGAPIQVISLGDTGPTLMVSTTSTYTWVWNDQGSGANMDVTIWRPVPADPTYSILGDYAQGNYSQPTGVSIVVKVINDDPNNPVLKAPKHFNPVWNDKGSGGDYDGSIWYPAPNDGYVTLGFVGQLGYGTPVIPNLVCVRQDFAEQAQAGNLIWSDKGSGADEDVSLWAIQGSPNLFVAQANYNPFSGSCYKLKST